MTDRPIIFSAPMVKALLEGRKTQTRRVLCLHDDEREPPYVASYLEGARAVWCDPYDSSVWCYPGVRGSAVGDRLWVREAWARAEDPKWMVAYRADGQCGAWGWDGDGGPLFVHHGYVIEPKRRDGNGNFGLPRYGGRWRSPIHMPRWASRLTLIVTDVRVQRLAEMTEQDAVAEGIEHDESACAPLVRYAKLWDDLNAKRGFPWSSNPWVCAITFRTELNSEKFRA